ncbi:MAG: hypothetical protein KC964_06485 [Candidatus Omnitrophica bacterium]|nr:hypothetical protein [Candidatus Omnitrophota bacterium]
MDDHHSIDEWLEAATEGLAEESIRRIREDIQTHFESVAEDLAVTATPREPMQKIFVELLGDPLEANRRYRKSYRTEEDADWDRNVVAETYAGLRRKVRLKKRFGNKVFLGATLLFWVGLFGVTLFNREESGAQTVLYGLIGFPVALLIVFFLLQVSEWWRWKAFLSGYRHKSALAIWAGGVLFFFGLYSLFFIPNLFWLLRTVGIFSWILVLEVDKGIRMYERLKGNEPIRLD